MKQTFLNGKIICEEVKDIGHLSYYNVTTELGTDEISVWHDSDNLEEKAKGVYKHQLWVEILDTICSADEFGNRPCDWGCPCDRCMYDWGANHRYATVLKNEGLDYSFYAKYL